MQWQWWRYSGATHTHTQANFNITISSLKTMGTGPATNLWSNTVNAELWTTMKRQPPSSRPASLTLAWPRWPCNMTRGSVWTYLKWKMYLCCIFPWILTALSLMLSLNLVHAVSRQKSRCSLIIFLFLMPQWIFSETYFLLLTSSRFFKKAKEDNQ